MPNELDLLKFLDRQIGLSRRKILKYDMYYEGEQPLRYMAPELEAEIGDRVTQLVINWPRMCVDAYENRLDITGFRRRGDDDLDPVLWDMFTANDGVAKYTEGHVEHLVCGRFYTIVGSPENDGDPAVMTVEHPLQIAVHRSPKTREVTEALKRWKEDDGSQWANLYLPNSTITYMKAARDWRETERDDHGLDRVLVTEFLNRGRILRKLGVSEFHDVIPVADAANKMATDMMISGEFHATPRRWATGMTKSDFVDPVTGEQLSTFEQIVGRIWASENKDAKYGQFDESELTVFHGTIKVLAQIAAQLMYLPQDYMSFSSDNPMSADGMRASESRMIKRAERMQTTLGTGWKRTAQNMLLIDGASETDNTVQQIEVLWRNAATPTIAQIADASVKLASGPDPIIDKEQAREDIGYTPGQRRRMAERDVARRAETSLAGLKDLLTQTPTGQGIPNAAA